MGLIFLTGVLMVICFAIIIMSSRFALLKIKDKDQYLYKKILKSTRGFPEENDYGMMDANTQFTLYKYLFFNKENIREVVPKHPKVFRNLSFVLLILFVIQIVNVLFLTEVLGT